MIESHTRTQRNAIRHGLSSARADRLHNAASRAAAADAAPGAWLARFNAARYGNAD